MRTLSLTEYLAEVRAQGVPRFHIAMKCPVCATIQSAADLVAAGAGRTFDEVESYLGFSCVGRFTNAGGFTAKSPIQDGCDWTLGGLFRLHELEVETEDGKRHPRFELATPEEAQILMKRPRIYRERRCRKCGCIEEDCSQCIRKTGEPCSWVEEDLCSACV